MMKKITIYLVLALLLINCTEKDQIPQNIEVQNFIWKGLNLNYLWQDQIPELSDFKFSNQKQLNDFIGSNSPNLFFESLLFERGISDRFSWIVDDYITLENSFAGISQTNGMEFGLLRINGSDDLFGFVRYVLPGSDASNKGINRGDIFNAINGTNLNVNNYQNLLFSTTNYTVNFANYSNSGGTVTISSNGNSTDLIKEELTENPVHTTSINMIDGHKIGYLLYNQFTNEFDSELNQTFSSFKNENITDLVLDLRYNGGGSVNTAISLCSMITGQFTNEELISLKYNTKLGSYNDVTANFPTALNNGATINSLNLNSLYVLVSEKTASASELVINALKPYIDVQLIGTQTVGKTVGSVTLYDSDNYRKTNVNPNHFYAMQPIVFSVQNKLGDFEPAGFTPNIILPENYNNLGDLGNTDEPLFEQAINQITGTRSNIPFIPKLEQISNSKDTNYAANNMYLN